MHTENQSEKALEKWARRLNYYEARITKYDIRKCERLSERTLRCVDLVLSDQFSPTDILAAANQRRPMRLLA